MVVNVLSVKKKFQIKDLFIIYIFIRPQKFAVVLWYDAVVVAVGVVIGVCRQVGFRMITFVLVNQSFIYFGTLLIGSK